ncbi:MAG: DUF4203 domain-containing protein, partial [Lachnospiraceae bacterium]
IVAVVLGMIACFLGLRLVKLWISLLGLLLGGTVGYVAGVGFGATKGIALIFGAALGIVIAILLCYLHKVGVFLLCLIVAAAIGSTLLQPASILFVGICAAIGLVAALISLKWGDPMVIVCTVIGGALCTGTALVQFIHMTGSYYEYIISGGLALIGFILQFLYASKKVNKKSVAKAKKIRAEKSVENEVEAARAILDQPEEELEEEFVEEDFREEESVAQEAEIEEAAQEIIEETHQELREKGTLDESIQLLDFDDDDDDDLEEFQEISKESEVPEVLEAPEEDEATKAKRELEEAKKEIERMKQELEEAKKQKETK